MPTSLDLLTSSYSYHLPEQLIANTPSAQRDGSRMLVVDRTNNTVEHRNFSDIQAYLQPKDCVVMNNAKVVPARLFSNDEKVEILWQETRKDGSWRVLGKPGKKLRLGKTFAVAEHIATVTAVLEDGDRILSWKDNNAPNLEQHGKLALPHYFQREEQSIDETRYQTVFAKREGAIAAPTAGLHFTTELIEKITPSWLTLFVGVGTFRPVSAENVSDHQMHSEHFDVPKETITSIQAAKDKGGRCIAVGTTVTRVLEHLACTGGLRPEQDKTNIFLHPPYQFQAVDALLTNFHLPQSTLLMLISAFIGDREKTLSIYQEAVEEQYRFFSYGDCMLIL